MFSDRLRRQLATSGSSYSNATWSTTGNTNITLSNGNLTATANSGLDFSLVRSNLAINGSIYVEVAANSFSNAGQKSGVGLKLNTDAFLNQPPVTGNGLYAFTYSTSLTKTYGISFNPTTGAYQIRENNTLVASGTLTPNVNWRICAWTGSYNIWGIATINTGASPFTYTPVYL